MYSKYRQGGVLIKKKEQTKKLPLETKNTQ